MPARRLPNESSYGPRPRSSLTANNQDPMDSALFFIHVPKTGGTTFSSIIERLFAPEDIYPIYVKSDNHNDWNDFVALSDVNKQKVKAFYGHVYYGQHVAIPQPVRYITIMRDPVERVISLYCHFLNDEQNALHEEVKRTDIQEFVGKNIDGQACNQQTMMLAGRRLPLPANGSELLEIAKKNVDENILVTGFTERFDETLVLTRRLLDFPPPYYVKKNISNKKFRKKDFDQATIELIRECNSLDYELYDYAMKRFDEKILEQGPNFKEELEDFITKNANWKRQE